MRLEKMIYFLSGGRYL